MSREKNSWLHEYEEFLSADAPVPVSADENIRMKIGALLNPSPWIVFGKILSIHMIVGFLSLSFCHQFALNPFSTAHSLDSWLMNTAGHNVCMIVCGVVFLSVSILASGYFLSLEESRALKENGFPHSFALGLVSLGLFSLFGAELALSLAGLWFLGALVGGFVSAEIVWKLKYVQTSRLHRV